MIIGHSHPQDITWTLSGTGAAFVSPVQLGERPDRVTAIRWLSGTQTTASVLRLRADWDEPMVPGLVYLANTDLPVGTRVEVAFKRPLNPLSYNYSAQAYNASQRITEGPRGERTCAILLQPGAHPVIGCEIRIYNDVGGSPTIPASEIFTLGAAMICQAAEVQAAAGIEFDFEDPTTTTLSATRGAYSVPGIPYRTFRFALCTTDQAAWFGAYAPLIGKIDRGQPAVYIARYRKPDRSFDAELLHGYAMIGRARQLGGMRHAAGPWFESGEMAVIEDPVPV